MRARMADLVLDFNACKSIVVAGASRSTCSSLSCRPLPNCCRQITGYDVAGSHVYAEQQSTSGPVVVTGTVAYATHRAFTLWPLQPEHRGRTCRRRHRSAAAVVRTQAMPAISFRTCQLRPAPRQPRLMTTLAPRPSYTVSGAVRRRVGWRADLVEEQTVTSSGRRTNRSTSTTSGPTAIRWSSACRVGHVQHDSAARLARIWLGAMWASTMSPRRCSRQLGVAPGERQHWTTVVGSSFRRSVTSGIAR